MTGNTNLTVRGGPGQGNDVLATFRDNALTKAIWLSLNGYGAAAHFSDDGTNIDLTVSSSGGINLSGEKTIGWCDYGPYLYGANTVALAWGGSGILKITDGSTGQGGIGIADSATNTVSDALILRHATSGTAAASFGTGLLFQGEDAAGNMQDMARISAVYAIATNGSEQSKVVLQTEVGGAAFTALQVISNGASETFISAPSGTVELAGSTASLNGANNLYFMLGNDAKWTLNSSAHFAPVTTNTYDIGTSSAFVRNNYVSTSVQGTRDTVLTDNTITSFTTISSTAEANANGVTAGHISYTVVASDATTDIVQTETGNLPFLLVNENGTVTVTLGTVYGTAIDSAGGAALANTFAYSVSGTNATIRVTSDYDQATLTGTVTHTIRARVYIDSGTATVTPIP